MSLSKGLHITLFTGRGDKLEAGSKSGAATVGDLTGSGTDMAFSIRLCTVEGCMTCSSGGGVGPFSFASTGLAFKDSAGLLWLSLSRSCSAALCRAASTSSLRSLKS